MNTLENVAECPNCGKEYTSEYEIDHIHTYEECSECVHDRCCVYLEDLSNMDITHIHC